MSCNLQLAVVNSFDQIKNVIVSRHASAVHKTRCILVWGSVWGVGGLRTALKTEGGGTAGPGVMKRAVLAASTFG